MSNTVGITGLQETPVWKDYYELCKPGVVLLMLLTSLIGMLLAVPGWVPLNIIFWGNLGIALCASSAAAVNHLVDRLRKLSEPAKVIPFQTISSRNRSKTAEN